MFIPAGPGFQVCACTFRKMNREGVCKMPARVRAVEGEETG